MKGKTFTVVDLYSVRAPSSLTKSDRIRWRITSTVLLSSSGCGSR